MLKYQLTKFLFRLGFYKLIRWMSKSDVIILMYHGFSRSNKESIGSEKLLDIEEFENHLQLIKEYFTPVSLDTVFAGNKLPDNPIVITIDDGYRNNYTYAFPLLKKYGIPVTLFIPTGFIDRKVYLWTDRLEYMVAHTTASDFIFTSRYKIFQLKLKSIEEKKETIKNLKKYLKDLSQEARGEFLDELQERLSVEYNWDTIPSSRVPLSWREIREMHQSGLVTFGSHTVSHSILSRCSSAELNDELRISRKRISEEIGERCQFFSYPNGKTSDYNSTAMGALKKNGYKGAVTALPGPLPAGDIDNFQLRRFNSGLLRQSGLVSEIKRMPAIDRYYPKRATIGLKMRFYFHLIVSYFHLV